MDEVEKEEIRTEGPTAPGFLGRIQSLFRWLRENERHISAPIFILGFISDIFTVASLPVTSAVFLYGAYLSIALFASIGAHFLYVRKEEEGWFLRSLRVLLSLAAQFTVGGTLSGCLIFYTKNAALQASWPFILLLIGLFVGNEFLRKYREQLVFRNLVFFFALYAYLIYALPTYIHTINPETFLESTILALGIYVFYLLCLAIVGWHRFKENFWLTFLGAAIIALLVCISYFEGLIPPLPLSLREIGVYHSVTHTGSEYTLQEEASQNLGVIHILPGDSLSVFSSVFAPISFSTAIIHKWEWYNPQTHHWQERAQIAFGLEGGRDGGYRGYSTLSDIVPGKYRVLVDTLSGQVIGEVTFTVQNVTTEPALQQETR